MKIVLIGFSSFDGRLADFEEHGGQLRQEVDKVSVSGSTGGGREDRVCLSAVDSCMFHIGHTPVPTEFAIGQKVALSI